MIADKKFYTVKIDDLKTSQELLNNVDAFALQRVSLEREADLTNINLAIVTD